MPVPHASQALSRFTVLDLTRVRAGPTCVRQLADWGANVIKIDALLEDGGETMGGPRRGFDFQNLHRNKRAMTLNLKDPKGREVFMRLVEKADVVVENYRPDVKTKLGVDYGSVRRVNPRIVYGSISGFGQDGPYKKRPGFDQIAQGMGGLMSITGAPGEGPMRVGIPVADLTAGMFCAMGILTALLERERSGRGQWVHTSLLQANIRLMEFQAARYLMTGEVPGQAGNYHPISEPTGVYRARDGSLIIQAGGQSMFARLCRAIDGPELLEDERFKDGRSRLAHRPELTVEIEQRLQARAAAEWIELLTEAGVPAGTVLNVEQCFADEQVKTLPVVATVEHPVLGTERVLASGVNLARTPPGITSAAPELGQHTDDILRELGYDANDIATFRREGVII